MMDVSSSEFDFGFAFNDSNYFDRVLRIEIITDPVDAPSNSVSATATAVADSVCRGKRKRENYLTTLSDEQISNKENQDEETVEEFSSVDEFANNNDSNWIKDCSAGSVVSVKTLHISSLILAAKSTFFKKLLSNGMSESEQRHVTLKINASEEAAFMELLNFMYRNSLNNNITAASALLDVFVVADKFEVSSCMRYCTQLLLNSPMTLDSALLYLDLPHSVLMADAVQPLVDAAKQYLVGRYKDISKFQQEAMALPLFGIEVILASDDLQVLTEDVVYDFALVWARQHYNKEEERQEVLDTRLAYLIRFPYMSCKKLKGALIECKKISKLALEALLFKAEAGEESACLKHHGFVERAYKYRPVKVVRFELSQPQCVVYLNLKREECATLFPSGRVFSQTFYFGGQGFLLIGECFMDQQVEDQHGSSHYFGLSLGIWKNSAANFTVDYEFAARSRTTEEFVSKFKHSYTYTHFQGGKVLSC